MVRSMLSYCMTINPYSLAHRGFTQQLTRYFHLRSGIRKQTAILLSTVLKTTRRIFPSMPSPP